MAKLMDSLPKVSVIIPAHNAATFIEKALGSVLSQDWHNLEIVIVDDGSTDDLTKVTQNYMSDVRIKYIRTENRGVSHALNTGLKLVSGDYICFLHADDLFLPDKIKKQVTLMEKYPSYGISYTKENYSLEGTECVIGSPYAHFSGDIFYFLKRSNFIHMSTTMFRKKVFETISLDEGLACHEDWDLFLKLSYRSVNFLYLPQELSSISVHPKSLSYNTVVMDATRAEVGARAKRLWHDFKREISITSLKGVSNLIRYISFKTLALLTGFPWANRYNRGTPKELFSKYEIR